MPSLGKAVVYFIIAAIAALAAWNLERVPLFVRSVLVIIGVICASAGIVELANYLAAEYAARTAELNRARAMQPVNEFLRLLSGVDPLTQRTLAAYLPSMGFQVPSLWAVVNGQNLLVQYLDTGSGRIPFTFVEEFLQASNHRYLRPVRAYGEGTQSRQWALEITAMFLSKGLAEPAAGNRPARWVVINGRSAYYVACDLFRAQPRLGAGDAGDEDEEL